MTGKEKVLAVYPNAFVSATTDPEGLIVVYTDNPPRNGIDSYSAAMIEEDAWEGLATHIECAQNANDGKDSIIL